MLNPESFNPRIVEALKTPDLNPLSAGTPDVDAVEILKSLTPEAVTEPDAVADRDMAQACLAGLWLLHNYLDESHEISQDIHNASGSFWHGIMHRREGDFSNAKYWFARVGMHPAYQPLGEAVRHLAAQRDDQPTAFLREQTIWDPNLFTDLCERAVKSPSELNFFCRQVQRLEWEFLFEFCHRIASGR